jgi:hypothetical protein
VLQVRLRNKKVVFVSVLIALVLCAGVFAVIDYRRVPIRTTHTLKITNTSEFSDIAVLEVRLPGDEVLQLDEAFPEYVSSAHKLILQVGESLSYQREFAGGIQFDVQALAQPAEVTVEWDGDQKVYSFEREGEIRDVQLDGSSWGQPSLIYRALGIFGLICDVCAVFIIFLVFIMCIWKSETFAQAEGWRKYEICFLDGIKLSLWINLGILLLGIGYTAFFNERVNLINLSFLAGIILLIREVNQNKKGLLIIFSMGILLIGILTNIYFWIVPPHDLHQVLHYRPYNSFEYLADRIGARNATYLSIGYYRYLRESHLIIPENLYDELLLNSGRLERLNQLEGFLFEDYDCSLSESQVDELLSLGEWKIWPNRTGGEYYLLPEISQPGDTYYFFESGLRYFLIPQSFIQQSGVIDVPISH